MSLAKKVGRTMDLNSLKVGFIGGGNMAKAIGGGLIKKGVLDPKNVWVSARTQETLEFWKQLGTFTSQINADVVKNCEIIVVAVKPQMLEQVAESIRPEMDSGRWSTLLISVLVGVTIDAFRTKLAGGSHNIERIPIVRTMPNTPLMVGQGVTVYCADDLVTKDQCSLVHTMFSHLGLIERIPESQMNAVSALSGSGPAFAYEIIESLSDGAVMAGVPRALATKLAAQVLVGAGSMVLETKKHPGELKDEVCSAGGTTICGVHAMEKGAVRAAMMNAIKAAVDRAGELSTSN